MQYILVNVVFHSSRGSMKHLKVVPQIANRGTWVIVVKPPPHLFTIKHFKNKQVRVVSKAQLTQGHIAL